MKWTTRDNNRLHKEYPVRTDKELEKIFKRNRGTIRRQASTLGIKKTCRSPVVEWELKISKDLFYVLGVIEGDGYVERNTPFKIALGVTDESFIKKFHSSLVLIGLTPSKKAISIELPKKRKHSFESKKILYRLRVYSKLFSEWYWERFDYHFISHYIENENYMMNFLAGFFDSEGSLEKNTLRAKITNTDKELLLLCQKILFNYGFHPTILQARGGNLSVYNLVLNRKEETKSFINKIQPCIERKTL